MSAIVLLTKAEASSRRRIERCPSGRTEALVRHRAFLSTEALAKVDDGGGNPGEHHPFPEPIVLRLTNMMDGVGTNRYTYTSGGFLATEGGVCLPMML